MTGKIKSPLSLWHLLSLDAPTVATLWTWFIARASHVPLSAGSLLAMATAVWMLYAADRLLDVRGLAWSLDPGSFEARHHFHYRHRTGFVTAMIVASITLAVLLPRIPAEAIRLYLVLGGLVFGYFVVIHASRNAHRLPKEIAVGVFFAAAVFIPTVARRPDLRPALVAPALIFAALCSLNCLFIYAWEHPAAQDAQPPHPITASALAHLPALTVGVGAAAAALGIFDRYAPWPIEAAAALSAIALLMLHRRRKQYDALTLRSAADLALLSPALLVYFL